MPSLLIQQFLGNQFCRSFLSRNLSVIVSAEGVSKPVAVRFGWHETAEPNLANAAGLPASPFRTDKWTDATMPVITPPPAPAPVKK